MGIMDVAEDGTITPGSMWLMRLVKVINITIHFLVL